MPILSYLSLLYILGKIYLALIRGDVKIHQGPSQPFNSYCLLSHINLPLFTLT